MGNLSFGKLLLCTVIPNSHDLSKTCKGFQVGPSLVSWQSEVFILWHTNTRASLDLLQADVVICQLRDVRYDTVVVFDEVLVGLPGWRFGWENAGTWRSFHSWMEVSRFGHRFTLTLLMHSYRSGYEAQVWLAEAWKNTQWMSCSAMSHYVTLFAY